jgi:hypothetical protein
MSPDRESCELLREIVRPETQMSVDRIARILPTIQNWDVLLTTARSHGVLPLLYLRLTNQHAEVPPSSFERMQSDYDRNVLHSLTNAAELISVLKDLSERSIPAMPFKGVVLSATAYRDLTARPAGDLDVLIFYRDLIPATEALLKRGYELTTSTREDGSPSIENYYEYHFERQSDGMVLELRWRLELTQPRFKCNLGMDWIWPRRRSALLAGAEVPDMDPEIAVLVLCMHGSKHVWSRLIWISDVARLLEANPQLDWNRVKQEAKARGLWRSVALGVLLAHRVGQAVIPEPVLRGFESDSTARILAQHIADNLFKSPGSTPNSRLPYNVQLLGLNDRVKMLFSMDFLRPNARDRAVIQLPKVLEPLYFLIRPVRILWDKTAR